jgi:hypothetical protein
VCVVELGNTMGVRHGIRTHHGLRHGVRTPWTCVMELGHTPWACVMELGNTMGVRHGVRTRHGRASWN